MSYSISLQAVEYGKEVLIPDLGSDRVWRLVKESGAWVTKAFIQQPLGSGPRHIVPYSTHKLIFPNNTRGHWLIRHLHSDGNIYTLHELTNTLSQQAIPPLGVSGSGTLIANISTLPTDIPANSLYGAAELLISPATLSSPQRYLYASNRNVSPQASQLDPLGDTIAIFAIYPTLHLVKQVHTGLQQIRGLTLGGGVNGPYIAAAGKEGGGIAVYERVSGGADLKLLARYNGTGTTEVVSFAWA